jgi:predicted  nucleic acid-binding Zn-ribbon protein
MYNNTIIEFIDLAIENKGIIQIEQSALDYNVKCRTSKTIKGKPLSTYQKKFEMLEYLFINIERCFPVLMNPLSNTNLKKYLNSVFIVKDGEYFLNVYNALNIKHHKIESLYEFRDFFIRLKSIIMKHNTRNIFFSFTKELNPVRFEFSSTYPTDEIDFSKKELTELDNIIIPESIQNWLDLCLKSSFIKNNRWCVIHFTFINLLSELEKREFLKLLKADK